MNGKRVEFRLVREDGDAKFWYVEAYSPEGNMFPVGTAYVFEVAKEGCSAMAQLNFIFVADQWRRQGYGELMAKEMLLRWPKLQRTGPMDDLAKEFGESVFGSEPSDEKNIFDDCS